jgi:hypothetical protein
MLSWGQADESGKACERDVNALSEKLTEDVKNI